MKRTSKYLIGMITGIIAFCAMGILFFLFHIPGIQEIKFHWRLQGRVESPLHIHEMTDFEWHKVCIEEDANGWPIDWVKRRYFILRFFDQQDQLIAEFYLPEYEQGHLEPHIGDCFAPEQIFFINDKE